MIDPWEKTQRYDIKIKIAINAIKSKDYNLALISIKEAGLENQNLPEYHNLLGVIAESRKDVNLACRHYRAAYALDPTYKPACNNMERITNVQYGADYSSPDLGENYKEESDSTPLFLFDFINFNHKRSKGRR